MAVPKRKTTPSRRNNRRSHDALKGVNVVFDKDTGEAKLPHHVCMGGYYNGRLVKAEKESKEVQNSEAAPVTQTPNEAEQTA